MVIILIKVKLVDLFSFKSKEPFIYVDLKEVLTPKWVSNVTHSKMFMELLNAELNSKNKSDKNEINTFNDISSIKKENNESISFSVDLYNKKENKNIFGEFNEEKDEEIKGFRRKIENHIIRKIYKYIFPKKSVTGDKDIHKITQSLEWIQPENLDIKKTLNNCQDCIVIAEKLGEKCTNTEWYKEIKTIQQTLIQKTSISAPPPSHEIEQEFKDKFNFGIDTFLKFLLSKYPIEGYEFSEQIIEEYHKNK